MKNSSFGLLTALFHLNILPSTTKVLRSMLDLDIKKITDNIYRYLPSILPMMYQK